MCLTEFNEKAYVESVKQEAFEIFKEQIAQKDEQITQKDEQIAMQSEQIAQLLERIKELENK